MANAPLTAASVGQPNTAVDLARVASVFPRPWPDDLRTWYELADGADRSPSGYLIPGYRPLSSSEIISSARQWRLDREAVATDAQQRIANDILAQADPAATDMYNVSHLEAAPAGQPVGLFLPSFVPIAEDLAGAYLFVDLRDGDLRGCVTAFLKGDADAHGPLWPSVTAMLSDIASALANGTAINYQRPESDDGRLNWAFDFEALG